MKTSPSISVLTFEFCRTEEQSNGPELASITRTILGGEEIYSVHVVSHWKALIQHEEPFRMLYIRRFIECLQIATHPTLKNLFEVGVQVSAGLIRGRLQVVASSL